jgi:hypothetical protein
MRARASSANSLVRSGAYWLLMQSVRAEEPPAAPEDLPSATRLTGADRRLGAPEGWVSYGREDAQISRFGTRLRQRGGAGSICMLPGGRRPSVRAPRFDDGEQAQTPDGTEGESVVIVTACACVFRFALLRRPLEAPLLQRDLQHDLAARVPARDPRQRFANLLQRQHRPRPGAAAGRHRPGGLVAPAAAGRRGRRTTRR